MKRAFVFLLMLPLLAACAVPNSPAPTPTASPVPPTATIIPATATPIPPTPTPVPPTATPTPEPVDTAELSAQLMAELYPPDGVPPADGTAITGVQVLALNVPAGRERLWAAFSTGFNGYPPDEPRHFIAIFSHDADGWHKKASLELTDPDYVDEGSVQQVALEPSHLWLWLEGGAGAHSGIFNLFQFDGDTLSLALSGFNASPGVGQIVDLNDDGVPDVILNASDPYVFCYVCNVNLPIFQVYRWTGAELAPVTLTGLGDDAPADLRAANNEMVSLAEAWLWKDAQSAQKKLAGMNPDDPTVVWNLRLVTLHATALAEEIGVSSYPLLAYIFYGDYDGALDILRQYSADELFSAESPLVVETPAFGWEAVLRDWIFQATDLALSEKPTLATAHFLRGWATFINDGMTDEVRAELKQAASLSPDEPLFVASEKLTE